MKSAFSTFVKDLKNDIKKELKIGDEKEQEKKLKEVDSGVVENGSEVNEPEEELAEYSDDESVESEVPTDKKEPDNEESSSNAEESKNKSDKEPIEDKVQKESKIESSQEDESSEIIDKTNTVTEPEPVKLPDNNDEKAPDAPSAEPNQASIEDKGKQTPSLERPSIKRQKSAIQSFIDEASQKPKKSTVTPEIKKQPRNNPERTYVVESGRPASQTKSSTARTSNSGHVPMAEMIYRDQNRLPDRFRYKPVELVTIKLTRTVPVSPVLQTYQRKGKSRRELEGERLRAERIRREEESYQRPQFVARKYCFD